MSVRTETAPFVVGIAGGSGSGKTSLARGLTCALGADTVTVLAEDAYYRDHGHLSPADRAVLNYDRPDTVDLDLLAAAIRALRGRQPVPLPCYCFASHRRLGFSDPITPSDVVLVDGLFLFHDRRLRDLFDLRIYVDAPEELRLERRAARDVAERGRSDDSVMTQWRTTVRPGHERYVEPSRVWADLVLLNAGKLDGLVEVAATVLRSACDRTRGAAEERAA